MFGIKRHNRMSKSYSNYLDNPLLASYFNSKERIAYFISLKHVDKKRAFHEELITILEKFLKEVAIEKAEDFLDKEIFSKKNSSEFIGISPKDIAQVKELNPRGCKLLGFKDPLSFQSLKSSYRKAAFEYHPDKGGRHEDMLAINDAYQQFHNLLCMMQEGVIGTGGQMETAEQITGPDGHLYEAPKSARDYIYWVKILLAEVYLDDWNLEKAFNAYLPIEQDQSYKPYFERDRHRILKFTETITKRLLSTALKEETNRTYETFTIITNEMITRGIGDPHYWEERLGKMQKFKSGEKKPRIILNHIRQAENALRLGAIDRKRFEKLGFKYKGKAELLNKREELLQEYIKTNGFIRELPYDAKANKLASKKPLIPEPEYYGNNIYVLDNDQQAEYFIAFSDNTNLQLLNKYLFVRLDSLINSVIRNFNTTLLKRSINELEFILSLQEPKKSGIYYIEKILELFHFFRDLNEDDLRERLELLVKICDKFKGKLCAEPGNNSLVDGMARSFPHPRIDLIIGTHLSFFEHARSQLGDLRRLYETGIVS